MELTAEDYGAASERPDKRRHYNGCDIQAAILLVNNATGRFGRLAIPTTCWRIPLAWSGSSLTLRRARTWKMPSCPFCSRASGPPQSANRRTRRRSMNSFGNNGLRRLGLQLPHFARRASSPLRQKSFANLIAKFQKLNKLKAH